MKKYSILMAFGVLGALLSIAAINLGFPEGTKPMPGDLQTTGNRSLMKINQILYESQTDITKPLGVQDVIAVTYLGAISNRVSRFPLLVTNLQYAVTAETTGNTNGAAVSAIQEIDNVTSDANSPSVLLCATMTLNTNCPLVAKVNVGFYSSAPTSLGASGAFTPTASDATNFLGVVTFTNWTSWGTQMVSTVSGINMGLLGRTNYAVVLAGSQWTNNAGSPLDTLKLTIQKAY